MPNKSLNTFFFSVVFPSVLAISLFIVSIFMLIIPSFETNIMDKKKEMISELTNTAWSLLDEYDHEFKNGNFTLEEAQKMAAARISNMRYGSENKDYFWIIDMHPNMIMHPYRAELIETDLSKYQDPNGKKLFVEASKLVAEHGEGFIDYMWQWKDDSSRIVPKLSYVRGFKDWGWIVGTGIYLEDVQTEIKAMKSKLLSISLAITLVIIIILSYAIRQSLKIENQRKQAENSLILSRQKYKSLVEASTEGTLMILNQSIIFANEKFANLIGIEPSKVMTLAFEDLFDISWNEVVNAFDDPKKSASFETKLKCTNEVLKEVIISVSKIKYDYDKGYIIITKEVSQQKQLEKATEGLTQELQTSLLLMNQPIAHFVQRIPKCSVQTSIEEAVQLMIRKKQDVLFIYSEEEIIGVINNSDLKKRVLAEKLDTSKPVASIMSSPVISIKNNALLYEAILQLKDKKVSHLAVKNSLGQAEGVISYKDIANIQQNSVSYLLREIERADNVETLQKIHMRVPVLVNALIESGDKTQNITRIITSVSDAIGVRIIELCLEDFGEPPCAFAFMIMGSEGRMEQTLSTDQDNAIVLENLEPEKLKTALPYFAKMAKQVNESLNTVGYNLCKGEIMAGNPKWTQPVSIWKKYFSDWINSSEPQNILDASIFFDFRCLYGKQTLVSELRTHVNKEIENKSVFFYHMSQSTMKFKPPTNVLNNKAAFDVKKVLLPVVSFIRLYSLQNKISETNSLLRIDQLHARKIITKSMYDELVLSYNYLMQLRFRFQAANILQNKTPDNNIETAQLTHIEIATLKKIFGEVNDLQTKLNFDFKGSM